jgi:hypothetical protein
MREYHGRRIHKSKWQSRDEVRELLQAIFVAEVLRPSVCIWLISPWVTDLPVIDNRLGTFDLLDPMWGPRQVLLSEVLARLLHLGSVIRIATRPTPQNQGFIESISKLLRALNLDSGALETTITEDLHEKGLLGDTYYLSGSMNLTYSGVELLEEALRFDTDPAIIAETRLTYYGRWGGSLVSSQSP